MLHFPLDKCCMFLVPVAVGQRAYVMAWCPVCVRASVNFYFKHLLLWHYLSDFNEVSQKCSCHGPFQNFLEEFDTFKNTGFHVNKT